MIAADAARKDVFTCSLSDSTKNMGEMIASKGQDDCIVLNDQGIVVGRTRRRATEARGAQATLEEVMELGPTTVRPDERLDAVVDRMRRRGVRSIVAATPDGKLVGVFCRGEVEALLGVDNSEIERE